MSQHCSPKMEFANGLFTQHDTVQMLHFTQHDRSEDLLTWHILYYIPQRNAGVWTGASQYFVNSSSRRTRVMEQPAISSEVI